MPKVKDFEKDYDTYKKKAALLSFVKKHYEFIKGKVSGGESLTAIFDIAQAMGFLKDFSLNDFQSAYHSHKARVEKKEKPAETAKKVVGKNSTSKKQTAKQKPATSDSGSNNDSNVEFFNYPQFQHSAFKKACDYASSNGSLKEFADIANAVDKADLDNLKLWLDSFIGGESDEVIYETLIAFFKKSRVEHRIFMALPQAIRNYVDARSKAPAAAVGGDLLNQSRG